MPYKNYSRYLGSTVGALALMAAASSVHAAGFQLKEQSAKSQGSAFAGATAEADDLSTIYFNPAGMMRLSGHSADTNLSYILPSSKLTLTSTDSTTSAGLATPLGSGNGGDAGDGAFVPAFYAMYDYSPDMKFGLAINTPFGLSTEYDDGWAGRYHALRSEILTVNFAPTVAYRVNKNLSIGAAAQIQYVEAELTTAVQDVGSTNAANDGLSKLTGDDIGFGARLGLLYEFNDDTRVGFTYHSRIKHELEGEVELSGISAATQGALTSLGRQNTTHDASAKLVTPDIFSLGVSHDVDDQWAVLGEVSRTQWTTFTDLVVHDKNGAEDQNIYENWTASHFVALGAKYKHDENQTFRFGVAFDEGAVTQEHRTARIPDADRYWLSLGYGYEKDDFKFNVGYSYIIADDVKLIETNSRIDGRIEGEYESDVNILAVNASWKF